MEFHTYFLKDLDVSNDNSKLLLVVALTWNFLENKKLVLLSSLFDKFLSTDNGKVLFVLAFLNCQNLGNLTCIWLEERNWKRSNFFKGTHIVESNFISHGYNESVHGLEFKQISSFKVIKIDRHLVILLIFSSVNIKTSHVSLVSDTKSNSLAKHGLVTVHVVVHDVF